MRVVSAENAVLRDRRETTSGMSFDQAVENFLAKYSNVVQETSLNSQNRIYADLTMSELTRKARRYIKIWDQLSYQFGGLSAMPRFFIDAHTGNVHKTSATWTSLGAKSIPGEILGHVFDNGFDLYKLIP
jgi:hypothetical protein